jgi:acyl carrier protein
VEKSNFLKLIDELLEVSPGTLSGSEWLGAVGWDSLAIIGFMALCDDQFGLQVSPLEIKGCETPDDLFALVQNALVNPVRGR